MSPATHQELIDTLNDLAGGLEHSAARYLVNSDPYVTDVDKDAVGAMKAIATAEGELAARLVHLIQNLDGIPSLGLVDAELLAYNYLSFPFLLDVLIGYKEKSIARVEERIGVADSRPDERNQVAWLTQLRHHFESLGASVHVNYRFNYDDWNINSHTFELRWYQNLFGDLIQLVPEFRYYSQSQASFYEPFYSSIRSNGLYSSDYRLSPYGSLSFGGRLQARIIDWPDDLDQNHHRLQPR